MSFRHTLLLLSAAVLVAVPVHPAGAQAPTDRLISGTVTNATTHTPIAAAVVTTDRKSVV